ncbi:hypothetical protein [Paraburkholderia fungorum]|uniref:Uncharacterized protein n=2 Tax=Paraburkholderia fungorum TaxID=134537 RepID=A0AAW3V3G3_9BURK|nr:hypothetical protein [Paraburkholderia fungorum]MBB4516631.1 hypothetical protein [Paraburkholderia fungorum]MBB5545111.1 hypothetical protein [Paraburkholderia fungorum]MBB6204896.1 hypothetical protein [Paraburkholderia fungorum]MBU7442482.1 hypothetical protein [Paraburkholderia fungorum]MDE1006303.1 hypothetical protein [Paraburkholderia fungorum]
MVAMNPGPFRLRSVRSQGLPNRNDPQLASGSPNRDAGGIVISRMFVWMRHISDFSQRLPMCCEPEDTFIARSPYATRVKRGLPVEDVSATLIEEFLVVKDAIGRDRALAEPQCHG